MRRSDFQKEIDSGWDCLEDGDVPGAQTHFKRALKLAEFEDEAADAHHALGWVYEAIEDHDAMVEHWLETRRLDLNEPLPEWHLSPAEFEKVAEQALRELTPEMILRLKDVPMLCAEMPSVELIQDGLDPRLLGLFSGIPLPDKSSVGGQTPALDTIHLFHHNLERASEDRDHLCEEIRITVLHETAHFFGLDEEEVDNLGLG